MRVRVVPTVLLALTVLLLALPVAAGAGSARPSAPRPSPVGAAAPTGPTVGLVGNSISWQSAAEIRRHVGSSHDLVYFNASIGATVAGQRPSMVDAVEAPGGPDILLIELGTNDAGQNRTLAQFADDIRLTLDAVTPHVDSVVWFDMKSAGSGWYPDFNRNAPSFNVKLREVAAEYPNVVVGHYSAWAEAAGPAAFATDLVHLSAWGQDEFGRLAGQAADGFDPALTTGPFWDVRDNSWAAAAIVWCTTEGLVSGYPNGSFRAIAGTVLFTVTRAQWLNIRWRQAGAPSGYPPAPWIDVPLWIDGAARWAAAEGVASGFPDGTLRPDQWLSRAEAISMLYRLSGSPPTDGLPEHGLTDVPTWIEGAVRLAVSTGIVAGYPDATFRGGVAVSRAQAATFSHKYAALPPTATAPPATGAPPDTTPAPPAPPGTAAPTTSVPPPTPTTPSSPPSTAGPTRTLP